MTNEISIGKFSNSKKYAFQTFCYHLYVLDWLRRIPVDTQLETLRQAWDDQTCPEEIGYNGECYACMEEFVDCEYQDEEYMKTILNDEQYKFYLKTVDKYEEE